MCQVRCYTLFWGVAVETTCCFYVQNQLVQFKELQMELGEMSELKESLVRELNDMQRRVKQAEADNETLSAQLQSSERLRKAVS